MNDQERVKPIKKRKCSTCGSDLTTNNISIPGLNRILDPSTGKLRKITWIAVIVVFTGVCLTLTIKQLQKYFKCPIESETIIERKQEVQFPTFSICAIDLSIDLIVKKIVEDKCHEFMRKDCAENLENILFTELNISLSSIWEQFDLKDIRVEIWAADFLNLDDADYTKTTKHFSIGSCTMITISKPQLYFSVVTRVIVYMETQNKNQELIFIPHGDPDFSVYEFEIFSHEVEYLTVGRINQLKIQEQEYSFLNVTGRECYDENEEGERIKQLVYDVMPSDSCRLPFMQSTFPDCVTLKEVNKSLSRTEAAIYKLLENDNRRCCNEIVYTITVDFLLPIKELSENSTKTILILKFADDTRLVINEYYSYTFPDLVSDLFAYWGFFLCLSALVFVEIIEFLIFKLNSIMHNVK